MTSRGDKYEPLVNDSILQGAGSAPTGQFTTNASSTTEHNDLWRHKNKTNAAL